MIVDTDKQTIEKISAISGYDKNIVKDVCHALLSACTIQIYRQQDEDEKEIVIPYVCNLKLSYCDQPTPEGMRIKVDIFTTLNKALKGEIRNINEGSVTPSQKFVQKKLAESLRDHLELENVEIDL